MIPDCCIAIVAPASHAPDQAGVERALQRLAAAGCRVKNFYHPAEVFQRFGAPDAARVAQLHAAASDPEVDIVLALRGGYGVSRLLPLLDWPLLARSGKLFVGHSDFTAIHMGLLAHGAPSFAGPMLCDDLTREDESALTMPDFWQCIGSREHTLRWQHEANAPLDLEGTLWGGNLAMLTHLCGTPWLQPPAGGILFIEDVNEHPFRVERMVLQLLYSGVLAQQKALVLGDFSNYRLGALDNGYDFAPMLDYLRSVLPLPIICGLQFGHIKDRVTLAVGSQARLVSEAGKVSLTMRGYPGLFDT